MAENYLVHYGTKGQKWGERRYQNPDGSLTALGRIHYGIGKARGGVRVVINNSKRKAKTLHEEHKEKVEKKKEEANERSKQEILRSANAKKILKNQDKFTTQELNDAIGRIRNVNTLNDQVKKDEEKESEQAKWNKAYNKLGRGIAKVADITMKSVDTINKFKDAKKKIDSWKEKDYSLMSDDELMNISSHVRLEKAKVISDILNTRRNIKNTYNEISGKKDDDPTKKTMRELSLMNLDDIPANKMKDISLAFASREKVEKDPAYQSKALERNFGPFSKDYSKEINDAMNMTMDAEYEKPSWFDELERL